MENVDYPALMLDFAGIPAPDSMQGRSFKTGVRSQRVGSKLLTIGTGCMAHHDNPGVMAIRTKTHKLVYYYGCNYDGGYQTPPAWELYGAHGPRWRDESTAAIIPPLKKAVQECLGSQHFRSRSRPHDFRASA